MRETSPAETAEDAVEALVRREWGRVSAALIARLGDFQLAEDALQDALCRALERWPAEGVPGNPRAWLMRTAHNRAVDQLRRGARFRDKQDELRHLEELRETPEEEEEVVMPDERLSLIFTCCHPALGEAARVALTLRSLGGLSTGEIARAFLVSETTLAQRLVRAQRKIRDAGIPYQVPAPALWPERLDSVLSVLYLIFNEGYAASSGTEQVRTDLCAEAMRLAAILHRLLPEEAEVAGLMALMGFHDARRPARLAGGGNFIPMEQQDRRLWNHATIRRADGVLKAALVRGSAGPYQLQAAISGLHCQADTFAETDWRQIAMLYEELHRLRPSPIIRLNQAVAISFCGGEQQALARMEALAEDPGLESYQPLHAAKADLLRRLGRTAEAAEAYEKAACLSENEAEKSWLLKQLAALPLN